MEAPTNERGQAETPGFDLQATLRGHSIVVSEILWLSSNRLISASGDKTLRLWDSITGKVVRRFNGHEHWVTAASVSPDEATLVSGAWDGKIRSWTIGNGDPTREFVGAVGTIWSLSVSPSGELVASASDDGVIRVWGLEDANLLHEFSANPIKPESHVAAFGAHAATAVEFTPNSLQLLAAYNDGRLILWDIATGKQVLQLFGHTGAVHSIELSPEG